jgi:hypothetical protein
LDQQKQGDDAERRAPGDASLDHGGIVAHRR